MALHHKHREWIEARGISGDLAEKLGLATTMRDGAAWLSVPYVENGKAVNHKYRLTSEKRHQMDKGGKLCLWNHDCLLDHSDKPVVICEGEWDALIALELGWRAVSVPNGASGAEGKLDYLWDAKDVLNRVKSFIVATDSDEAGLKLRANIVAHLGADKCSFVEYGADCKDLNETHQTYGVEAASAVLLNAKPMPVKGLYTVDDFPERAELTAWPTGIGPLGDMLYIVPGTLTVFTGHANMGKALALDTPIPTPSGWSTMGDLRTGDELFAADGSVCRVIAATDVQHDRPCYSMKFRDGETIVADENHLWLTDTVASRMSRAHNTRGERPLKPKGTDQSHKRTFPAVRSTGDIAASLLVNGRRNHSIGTAQALDLPNAELPLDPYLLGSWLGDGATWGGVMTSADPAIPAEFVAAGFPVTTKGIRHNVRLLVVKLREVGVFGNKHVPTRYKRGSKDQRLALLQGLMDTDGHCDKNGACEFVSTSETLARDCFELAVSLGIKASFNTKRAMLDGRDCGAKHLVRFHTALPVFRLERKLERLPKATTTRGNRFIVSCERVDSVPVRCIQIDHPSKLFLAGRSMVPTHNSTVMNTIIANMLKGGIPTLVASFETDVKPILRDGIRASLLGIASHEVRHADTREADQLIRENMRIITQSVDEDEEMDVEAFLDLCRVSVQRDGTRLVILDPWNELEHKMKHGEPETVYIGRALRAIKRFAKVNDVAFWIVAHPTKPFEGKVRMPRLLDISGSANWANKADYGLSYHRGQDNNEADLCVTKVRMGYPGRRGNVKVAYDFRTSSFVEAA